VWSEEALDHKLPRVENRHSHDHAGSIMHFNDDSSFADHRVYGIAVDYYSMRMLGNDLDALNAFDGILKYLTPRIGAKRTAGLPHSLFDWSLLFVGSNHRRRQGFPSYSWVGWAGGLAWFLQWDPSRRFHVLPKMETWLDQRTWIHWHEISADGSVNCLSESENCMKNCNLDRPDTLMHSEVEKEKKKRRARSMEPNRQTAHLDTALSRYKSKNHYFRSHHTFTPSQLTRTMARYNILHFWTFSLRLKIGKHIASNPSQGLKLEQIELLDSKQSICGHIIPNDSSIFESLSQNQNATIELLLLAEAHENASEAAHRYGSGASDRRIDQFDDFWVISIRPVSDNGVVERSGIGTIAKTAVLRSLAPGLRWREVLLG
jgi:hypothetical protein